MNTPHALLAPVVLLVAWTLVMWLWMYLTRIPAILALQMRLDRNAPRGQQMSQLPPRVRWKADNYNHLMEQPTIYYAIVLTLALLGEHGQWAVGLAWAYALLRVVHSLLQALVNIIPLRFAVFVISTLPLIGLTGLAIVRVLYPTG